MALDDHRPLLLVQPRAEAVQSSATRMAMWWKVISRSGETAAL